MTGEGSPDEGANCGAGGVAATMGTGCGARRGICLTRRFADGWEWSSRPVVSGRMLAIFSCAGALITLKSGNGSRRGFPTRSIISESRIFCDFNCAEV